MKWSSGRDGAQLIKIRSPKENMLAFVCMSLCTGLQNALNIIIPMILKIILFIYVLGKQIVDRWNELKRG